MPWWRRMAVIIPMQCEYFALEGLTALLSTIEKIRKYLNPDLKVEGLLRTIVRPEKQSRQPGVCTTHGTFRGQGLPYYYPT